MQEVPESVGAPEEIRTPDPQIRSYQIHVLRYLISKTPYAQTFVRALFLGANPLKLSRVTPRLRGANTPKYLIQRIQMPKIKLTQKAVDKLKAPTPSAAPVLVWDTGLKGFGLLISGKTATRTYIAQRDLPGGRTRRVSIASVQECSLADGRVGFDCAGLRGDRFR